MADLITDAELDDLLYNSRAGDLDELTQVIGGIEARRRHSPPQGNHAHTDGNTANESDGDVTDVLLYINGKNEDGNTPLHYAAANGHQDIVDYFLRRTGLPGLLAQNGAGNTALHWAAFNGHLAGVKGLVDRIEQLAGEKEAAAPTATSGDENRRADMTEEERDAADELEARKRSVWDVVNKAGRGPTSEAQMNGKEAVVDFLLARIVAAPSSSSVASRNQAGTGADEGNPAAQALNGAAEDEVAPDAQPEGERPAAAREAAEREEEKDAERQRQQQHAAEETLEKQTAAVELRE